MSKRDREESAGADLLLQALHLEELIDNPELSVRRRCDAARNWHRVRQILMMHYKGGAREADRR